MVSRAQIRARDFSSLMEWSKASQPVKSDGGLIVGLRN
jgi:hypothetical protein